MVDQEECWPRYFLEIAYHGGEFHGWQRQPNGVTVQEVLESALSKILRQEKVITQGCGRTDTGVHASQFFAHFNAQHEVEDVNLTLFKLNQCLPKSISVSNLVKVHPKAHARFDATERAYTYFLHQKKDPFLNGISLYYPFELDFQKMNEAAQLFTLHRDFSSFCKSGGGQKTTICLVRRADWTCLENGQWKFEIVADRFLRNMVRAVVGTLLDVGRNKLTLSEFESIFHQNNRNAAGESVFAGGLFLSSVKYPYL